jgi:hypothetical protein
MAPSLKSTALVGALVVATAVAAFSVGSARTAGAAPARPTDKIADLSRKVNALTTKVNALTTRVGPLEVKMSFLIGGSPGPWPSVSDLSNRINQVSSRLDALCRTGKIAVQPLGINTLIYVSC